MMDLLGFFTMVVVISASGALAPGPMFFANLSRGIDEGSKGGFFFSVGHTLVELPLVLVLAKGLLSTSARPLISVVAGLLGGVTLIIFGLLQIRGVWMGVENFNPSSRGLGRSSLILGMALSGLNPFFIFWWLTVGMKLIYEALALASMLGVLFMFTCHIWIDYAWLILTAHLAKKGRKILKSKAYKVLALTFGLLLLYYGTTFLIEGVNGLSSVVYAGEG
ncbi:LysE family transporter [Candidatus Bathyarchaeota archaeon]|nr:LysE family transporter [Candidatus Bathyarchaeota archaeon]